MQKFVLAVIVGLGLGASSLYLLAAKPRCGEGTVIVKELTRVLNPTFPDSSRKESSGRGYFNGEDNGIDMSIKDSKRFAKTNNWGFFTFGHHPMPYDKRQLRGPRANVPAATSPTPQRPT